MSLCPLARFMLRPGALGSSAALVNDQMADDLQRGTPQSLLPWKAEDVGGLNTSDTPQLAIAQERFHLVVLYFAAPASPDMRLCPAHQHRHFPVGAVKLFTQERAKAIEAEVALARRRKVVAELELRGKTTAIQV